MIKQATDCERFSILRRLLSHHPFCFSLKTKKEETFAILSFFSYFCNVLPAKASATNGSPGGWGTYRWQWRLLCALFFDEPRLASSMMGNARASVRGTGSRYGDPRFLLPCVNHFSHLFPPCRVVRAKRKPAKA